MYTTAAALTLFAAIPAWAQTAAEPSSTPSTAETASQIAPQDFIWKAAVGNMFEIQSSQWALENIDDPEIQEIANTIIADHEAAAVDLQAAAGDLSVPVQLDEAHMALMEELDSSDDPAATYLEQQTTAHREAISLYQTFAEQGEAEELTAYAEATLPVLQRHQEHIETASAASTDTTSSETTASETPSGSAQTGTETTEANTTSSENSTSETGVPVIALSDWDYDELYANGWSADEFIEEAEVKDESGETIGDIENILLDEEGNILSIVVEVGGFLDIGDTHVSVPWDQVTVGDTLQDITVPINDENVGDYSLYGEWGYFTQLEAQVRQPVDDDLLTGPRVWRASELIDDYVLLDSGVSAYGYVDDLIFGREGQLQAVVVAPDVGAGVGGRYAYPYYGYGYGFNPGYAFYALPYSEDEAAQVEEFDDEQMQN